MIFSQLVQEVMDRLNLTSNDARTRIEGRIQDRYRRITSSIGLMTSRRYNKQFTLSSVTDLSLPDYRLQDFEKVVRVRLITGDSRPKTLDEVSYGDVTNIPTQSRLPIKWAVNFVGADYVIITLDAVPDTTPFTIDVSGYKNIVELSDNDEPAFPADYHDILVEGALSDELRKMEKPQLAQLAEQKYESRLSDLRMFIARTSYMDLYQGKNKPNSLWYWPWISRISVE